jgi:uncharacterized membrane protein SpoIIM required for sporulation
MVLESLIKPFTAEKKPWEMFFYGILISSIALFLSFWIFREEADLVAVFFTVFACIPLLFHAIRNEEKKDMYIDSEKRLLKEHSRVIAFFLFLFLGLVFSFSMWYIFLPSEVSHQMFEQQLITIDEINKPSGHAVTAGFFSKIFFNNIKVLAFCILFAFFYGAGAIFILTWNATVIAAAIGSMAKGLAMSNPLILSGGFAFSRYLLHGIPEMVGYMIAGLAGGIISVAVINHDFRTKRFQNILFDAASLLLLAIGVLFFAAAIESFITPLIFS